MADNKKTDDSQVKSSPDSQADHETEREQDASTAAERAESVERPNQIFSLVAEYQSNEIISLARSTIFFSLANASIS